MKCHQYAYLWYLAYSTSIDWLTIQVRKQRRVCCPGPGFRDTNTIFCKVLWRNRRACHRRIRPVKVSIPDGSQGLFSPHEMVNLQNRFTGFNPGREPGAFQPTIFSVSLLG